MAALPTNIDSTYSDTGGADVALHQQHHDALHKAHNTYFYVNEYSGIDPTGSADSTSAIQAAIDDAYAVQSGSQRGGVVQFGVGIYKCNTGLTLKEGVTLQGIGKSGAAETRGTVIRCGATSITLMTLDGVSANLQSGVTIRDMTLDGNSLSSTTLLKIRLANRVRLYNVTFMLPGTQAILLDSAEDSVGGGDCSWHNFYDLHFHRCPIGIFSRHSMGVNIYGADFVSASGNTTDTHIKLGATGTPSLTTQNFRAFGMKYDEGGVHEDLQCAGFCQFHASAHENGTTATKIQKPATSNSATGSRNILIAPVMSGMTTGIDIGTNCDQNIVIGAVHVTGGTPLTDAGTNLMYLPDNDRGTARFPAGIRVKDYGGTTPTGGASGDMAIGTNKIWINAQGTWKSVTVT